MCSDTSSCWSCGMYVKDSLNYTVIERTSRDAFQALWIEIQFSGCPNKICGIIYRQHNSPQCFHDYFDETVERLSASNKSAFIIINLLGVEKCNYAHNFLLSLQSFSFIPTIDKPTRVHNNPATLIVNILLNRFNFISPAIIHNSVLSTLLKNKCLTGKQKNVISLTFQKMTL